MRDHRHNAGRLVWGRAIVSGISIEQLDKFLAFEMSLIQLVQIAKNIQLPQLEYCL